jgi:hypothetical protein
MYTAAICSCDEKVLLSIKTFKGVVFQSSYRKQMSKANHYPAQPHLILSIKETKS